MTNSKTVNGKYKLIVCCDGATKIWLAEPRSDFDQEVLSASFKSNHPCSAIHDWAGNTVMEFEVHGDLKIQMDITVRLSEAGVPSANATIKDAPASVPVDIYNLLADSTLLARLRNLLETLIAGRSIDSWAKLRLLFNYLLVSFSWKLVPSRKRLDHVLDSLSGDCADLALLFAFASHSIGVPSRTIFGFLCNKDDKYFQHVWVECYLPDRGWMPIDVALAQEAALCPGNSYETCGIDDPIFFFGHKDPNAVVVSRGFLFPKSGKIRPGTLLTAELLTDTFCGSPSEFIPLLAPYWIDFAPDARPHLVHGSWDFDVKLSN